MSNDSNTDRTTACPVCAAPAAPGWVFCGACGAALPATSGGAGAAPDAEVVPLHASAATGPTTRAEPDPGTGEAVREGLLPAAVAPPGATPAPAVTRRWRRHLRPIAVGLLVAVLAAVGIATDVGVRNRLDETRDRLARTAKSLDETTAALKESRAELATTKSTLSSTIAERDRLKADLDARVAELAGVRGTLNEAQNRLNLQAGQIETLKSCLNGVVQALGYAAYEDYYSALASLRAVEVSCQNAQALF